jgi:hypothetical protein
MKFIELKVRTAMIVHGFDEDNKEIVEKVNEQNYATKIVAISRIQSISEQFILVTSSHGRIMYWEYDDTLQSVREKLLKMDELVNTFGD